MIIESKRDAHPNILAVWNSLLNNAVNHREDTFVGAEISVDTANKCTIAVLESMTFTGGHIVVNQAGVNFYHG